MGDCRHPRAHPRASGSHGGPSCVWRSERRRVRLALVVALVVALSLLGRCWLALCGWSGLLRACGCGACAVRAHGSMRVVAGCLLSALGRCCVLVDGLACVWPWPVGRPCGRFLAVGLALGSLWPVRRPDQCHDGLDLGISVLQIGALLTRARARLELRSGGIHVNFRDFPPARTYREGTPLHQMGICKNNRRLRCESCNCKGVFGEMSKYTISPNSCTILIWLVFEL